MNCLQKNYKGVGGRCNHCKNCLKFAEEKQKQQQNGKFRIICQNVKG